MGGKNKGASQNNGVSLVDGKAFMNAKQVKADDGKDNGRYDKHRAFLFEKEPEEGDQDDVQGGDKTGFSGSGVLNAHLLKASGKKQAESAADSSAEQEPAAFRAALPAVIDGQRVLFADEQGNRQQDQEAEKKAAGVIDIGLHEVHGHTLCHKSRAPDQGGGQQTE